MSEVNTVDSISDAASSSGVPTSRTISAGSGMSGGGDLTADRTLTNADTLALIYARGASSASSIMGLDTTRAGVLLRDNATPIASTLFGVQTSDGSTTKFVDITAGLQSYKSSIATDGLAYSYDTTNAMTGANDFIQWKVQGQPVFGLWCWSGGGHQAGISFYNYSSGALIGGLVHSASGYMTTETAVDFIPHQNQSNACGGSQSKYWLSVGTYQCGTVAQALTPATSVTVDAQNGSYATLDLNTGTSVTALVFNTAHAITGGTLTLEINGKAAQTSLTVTSGATVPGGALVVTGSANAKDTLTFRFNGTTWRQISSALNQS